MTRARHVTPGRTAERLEKLRALVLALQQGELRPAEIGNLLKVGPSGVRKYASDLVGLVELVRIARDSFYRLIACAAQVQAFLSTLALRAASRPVSRPESATTITARDPARRFHIMADDEHYSIRISRAPAARDPLVSALFGVGPARLEARV
jgi:hypothetical protein